MGMHQHKALLVTSFNEKDLTKAHKKAKKMFDKDMVSELLGDGMNGFMTFLVAPSGSKLGWEPSQQHERNVADLIEFLDTLVYEDGSSSIDYAEVNYGELGATVESNCKNIMSEEN